MSKLKPETIVMLTECAELERARLTYLTRWPYNNHADADKIQTKINAITTALIDLAEAYYVND
jgi:hypothetical protein